MLHRLAGFELFTCSMCSGRVVGGIQGSKVFSFSIKESCVLFILDVQEMLKIILL
jgi:hypothetical protein